ncbi:GAF domain-containing protein [Rufibacter sediminis]|uniref:GAF domain-containing protein n=1 Tax=Rufibacter sediminis TaxID=2762756 RepID=A0ABR6VMV0_9BACT|nr:GAF domain-containing protein [Rufibacter sediminis]MBC3538237.1 GAF domain-containing protein [Rufibacter sediminis]
MDTKSENIACSGIEQERLVRWSQYVLLNETEAKAAFQHVTDMATRIFNVPWALVHFIETKSAKFKTSVSAEAAVFVDREIGWDALAFAGKDVFYVENPNEASDLFLSPFLPENEELRFYAGAPIRSADGINLGILAIADKKPRKFSVPDEEILLGLAAVVLDELEEWYCHFPSSEDLLA